MELTVQEKNSTLWHKIDERLTELIHNAQKKNEGPLDAYQTAEVRGRIRAYRVLQSLGDDRPELSEDDSLPA